MVRPAAQSSESISVAAATTGGNGLAIWRGLCGWLGGRPGPTRGARAVNELSGL